MTPLIILPVYNEERHVSRVIQKIKSYSEADILAIDDGSEDHSAQILGRIKGIRLIRLDSNHGYGSVLIRGFSYAMDNGYDVALTMDCDEQHEPHLIPGFLDGIKAVDIVSGNRYLMPVPKNLPPPESRKRINREVTGIINSITSYGLGDAFCGFKAYKTEALSRLSLDEKGYGFPLQLWLQAFSEGLTVTEIPVGLIYKSYNRSFGSELDDSTRRLKYYKRVIKRELSRISLPEAAV